MVSYRFCRPDDLPLLARAVNECYNVHFPDAPEASAERLKDEVRALDVWPSNAMVGLEGDQPVAVMIGTKRPDEVLIHKIGVRPDYRRRGHGLHLLTSLSQKLAVLGPPRLIAELPDDRPDLHAFFEAAGYRREKTYWDWEWFDTSPYPRMADFEMPIDAATLDEMGLLPETPGVSWARDRRSLLGGELRGLACAGPDSIEAYVLHRPALPPERYEEALALVYCATIGSRTVEPWMTPQNLLGPLLAGVAEEAKRSGRRLRVPRVAPEEHDEDFMVGVGLVDTESYHLYAAVATPA